MKKLIIAGLLGLACSAPAMAAHPMCGKTELADVMGNMKDKMKLVKKAMKSGDASEVAGIAKQLLVDVENADKYVPLAITDQKELNAQQQADFEKYRKGINFLKSAVEELASASDLKQAKAALGKISKASKKGHEAFKMDCDK